MFILSYEPPKTDNNEQNVMKIVLMTVPVLYFVDAVCVVTLLMERAVRRGRPGRSEKEVYTGPVPYLVEKKSPIYATRNSVNKSQPQAQFFILTLAPNYILLYHYQVLSSFCGSSSGVRDEVARSTLSDSSWMPSISSSISVSPLSLPPSSSSSARTGAPSLSVTKR